MLNRDFAGLRSSGVDEAQGGLDRGSPLGRILGEGETRSQCSLEAFLFCFFLTTVMEGSCPISEMEKTSLRAVRSPMQVPTVFTWGTKLVLGHLAAKLTDYSWIPLSSPLYLPKPSFPFPLLRRPKTDLGSKTLPLAS